LFSPLSGAGVGEELLLPHWLLPCPWQFADFIPVQVAEPFVQLAEPFVQLAEPFVQVAEPLPQLALSLQQLSLALLLQQLSFFGQFFPSFVA
jgi:hypothetical protein